LASAHIGSFFSLSIIAIPMRILYFYQSCLRYFSAPLTRVRFYFLRIAFFMAIILTGESSAVAAGNITVAPGGGSCTLFPLNTIFHQRIDNTVVFPTHPRSAVWLNSIGQAKSLRPDWGRNDNPVERETYFGIPYNVISGGPSDSTWETVDFTIIDIRDGNGPGVPAESDCGVPKVGAPNGISLVRGCTSRDAANRLFPFPHDSAIKLEGGYCPPTTHCGDRHLLVVETGACRLWEGYYVYRSRGRWQMYSASAWDLNSSEMRPDSWTSADAAGMPVLPFLAKADEASRGDVRHPLRVTFRDSVLDRQYVWPARHAAGNRVDGGIPFGAVLRLRGDFQPPAHWTTQAKALIQAMKSYGLYVADIGSDFFVTGEPSADWRPETISQLRRLTLDLFEFVDMGSITRHEKFRSDSYRSSW
jgi:hypothetical protein